MIARNDPRVRRALDQLEQNIQNANERTQENLFTFSQNYVNPCLASIGGCLRSCAGPCLSAHGQTRRRQRGRSRGMAEASFDFYDDWEADEADALLGLSNDEMDRLLAGSNSRQPVRESSMSYGATTQRPNRKNIVLGDDSEDGKKIIPSSSYFGFLHRLPFNIGSKGFSYKPSIADLQDHPRSRNARTEEEQQPLMDDSDDDEPARTRITHKRTRSGTSTSAHTQSSLSSRGDIFPSEDEMDDAVPLDDEFALQLERRTTGHNTDDSSSKSKFAKNRTRSHLSVQSNSSKSSRDSIPVSPSTPEPGNPGPSISHLLAEESNAAGEGEDSSPIHRHPINVASSQPISGLTPPQPSSPLSQGSDGKTLSINDESSFPTSDHQTMPGDDRETVHDSGAEDSHTADLSAANHKTFTPAALPRFLP